MRSLLQGCSSEHDLQAAKAGCVRSSFLILGEQTVYVFGPSMFPYRALV